MNPRVVLEDSLCYGNVLFFIMSLLKSETPPIGYLRPIEMHSLVD